MVVVLPTGPGTTWFYEALVPLDGILEHEAAIGDRHHDRARLVERDLSHDLVLHHLVHGNGDRLDVLGISSPKVPQCDVAPDAATRQPLVGRIEGETDEPVLAVGTLEPLDDAHVRSEVESTLRLQLLGDEVINGGASGGGFVGGGSIRPFIRKF